MIPRLSVQRDRNTAPSIPTKPAYARSEPVRGKRALPSRPLLSRAKTQKRATYASVHILIGLLQYSSLRTRCVLIGCRSPPADDDNVVIGQRRSKCSILIGCVFFLYKREDESCKRNACWNKIAGWKIKRASFPISSAPRPGSSLVTAWHYRLSVHQ